MWDVSTSRWLLPKGSTSPSNLFVQAASIIYSERQPQIQRAGIGCLQHVELLLQLLVQRGIILHDMGVSHTRVTLWIPYSVAGTRIRHVCRVNRHPLSRKHMGVDIGHTPFIKPRINQIVFGLEYTKHLSFLVLVSFF